MNLADLLTRQAAARPQALAVLHGDQSFSYQTLDAMVWGLCRLLADSGLRRGDVVGLHQPDPLLHLVAVLACARAGLVSVALAADGADTAAGDALLARTKAVAVLDTERGRPWAAGRRLALARRTVIDGATQADPALRVECEPTDRLHFKTSSGTTGTPKIVAATHGGMLASIEREIACIGYPPGERYLTPVSMRYDGPRRRYLACLAAGGTAVLPPERADVAALLDTLDRHDVRHFSCVPSQAHELALAVPPGAPRFPSMRVFRLSAGPSEGSLHQRVRERLTTQVWISYGCTELGPMTVAAPDLVATCPQTVGRPMPGISVQVVSEDGRPLPAGTVGLLRIRADGMPSGYQDDDEATARSFRQGWFHPGDLGRIDAQGLVFHMGRADGMMLVDGINVYPAEIEQALLSHPSVCDAVAMPLKHPVTHDVPVCAVVLAGDATVSEQDLMLFARVQLGSHRPRRIAVLEQIPRNEHGKVQRAALVQAVAARLGLPPPAAAARAAASQSGPSPAASTATTLSTVTTSGTAPAAATAPLAVTDDGAASAGVPLPPAAARQLSLPLSIRFQLMPRTGPAGSADLAALDAWLVGVMALDVGAASDPPLQSPDAHARAWLRRMLLLARALLQAARVPVFDAPQVLACEPAAGEGHPWQARLAFARVDELPGSIYDTALQGAFQLGRWARDRPVDDANRQAFFAMAQSRVLERLRPLVPMGKSTLPVLRAAHQRGIPFTHLGAGVMQLGWGSAGRRLDRSVTGADSAMGARLCADKATTAALLRKAGLPAPEHAVVDQADEALAAARRLGWPVVVKPADLERGEGVAVDVCDETQLRQAFEAAQALSRRRAAIVERQVEGTCHRLFIAQGRLLYAVKRMPMSVQGDGVSSVADLVAAEVSRQRQLPPWDRSGIEPLDALALAALARAGLTPQSVPAAGDWVALRRIESTAWGGVDEERTDAVHPQNLQLALAATALFGLSVAGIDIITADISRPWFETGAIINEVNFAPLLGGAAISRSHIPRFLDRLVEGSGTIPVEVFVGGDTAWESATRRWREQVDAGQAAVLSRADLTLLPSGDAWPMPFTSLYRRTRALVLHAQVHALVLVVQTDEWLSTGLPLERIDRLVRVDERLVQAPSGPLPAPPKRIAALQLLLDGWPRSPIADGAPESANAAQDQPGSAASAG